MQNPVASLDFETRSAVDLKVGVYRYAESSTTGVWCMAWRIGDGAVQRWLPGDPDPQPLLDHIAAGGAVLAHNMAFDRIIWNHVARRDHAPHWPEIKASQVMCSMAQAQAMALPAALDKLGEVLGATEQKDKDGKALMMRMCRPRKVADDGAITWWDAPENIQKLADYCVQDVASERAVQGKLFPLLDDELAVYRLDQLINDRGIMIDVRSVERAQAVVDEASRRANRRVWELTGGAVDKCSEVAKILAWLNARGIPAESVAKGEIDEIVLIGELMEDAVAVEVLRLRAASGSASVKKLKAMLNSVCADGRIRGVLQFHAATTGRWAGKIVQPHNLKRVPEEFDTEAVLAALHMEAPAPKVVDLLELLYGDPLDVLSMLLRAMFVAAPGKKFVGGDLSNIEGRMNAWLAGETRKLDAFRAYDAGTGPDLYKVTAAGILGKTVAEVTKADRQGYGKVPELACGYQGGVGAFQTMGVNLGVVIPDDQAQDIVDGWRATNPNIVSMWWELQDAAVEAVSCPGLRVPCCGGKVAYLKPKDADFLYCKIPSGRVLMYAKPSLTRQTITTRKGHEIEKTAVKYWRARGRAWVPNTLYGGLQCENIVQALARDVLVHGMKGAEAAGYTIVLHVHDELLCEVDADGPCTAEGLQNIMADLPDWAAGLPLAAAAWEDVRYVK